MYHFAAPIHIVANNNSGTYRPSTSDPDQSTMHSLLSKISSQLNTIQNDVKDLKNSKLILTKLPELNMIKKMTMTS